MVERLQRVMIPLMAKMNKPRSPSEVKIGIMDDPHINAASAGNGEFYVTTGLLEKANDDQMRGVLAHELAHDDLGHVAKAQRLGAGLQIGMVLLDQIIPGSGNLTADRRRADLALVQPQGRVRGRQARRRDPSAGRLLQGRHDQHAHVAQRDRGRQRRRLLRHAPGHGDRIDALKKG
mgnify:CR=1 FL=1